jgi:indolepyruvate ferredoxin oxidoreductase alpha subunit
VAIVKKSAECRITENCIGCQTCIQEIGCPAISVIDGAVTIDASMCTGCGLCSQICPVGAIEKEVR